MHDSLLHRIESGLTTEADAVTYRQLVQALADIRNVANVMVFGNSEPDSADLLDALATVSCLAQEALQAIRSQEVAR